MHTQDHGFDGSDTSKLKMDSSACLVLGGFWLNVQFLVRSTSRSRVVSRNKSSYLKRMATLCCKILSARTAIHMWKTAKDPSIPICHWHIKHHGSTGSFVHNGRETYTQHGPVVKPFLFPGPTQSWQLCESADECTKENY